jgi:hypothetical protein
VCNKDEKLCERMNVFTSRTSVALYYCSSCCRKRFNRTYNRTGMLLIIMGTGTIHLGLFRQRSQNKASFRVDDDDDDVTKSY